MAAKQRIVITDKAAIERLSFLSAVDAGKSPAELATDAVNMLWEKKGPEVMSRVKELSPFSEESPVVADDPDAQG